MSRTMKMLSALLVATTVAAGVVAWQTTCCALDASQLVSVARLEGRIVDGQQVPLAGVRVTLEQGTRTVRSAVTNTDGRFVMSDVSAGAYRLRAVLAGFVTAERTVAVERGMTALAVPPIALAAAPALEANKTVVDGVVGQGRGGGGGSGVPAPESRQGVQALTPQAPPPLAQEQAAYRAGGGRGAAAGDVYMPPVGRPENYAHVRPNRFTRTADEPLSTFGADVDTASFANVRRFLRNGQLPPIDAVRVEEFINYFRFDYAAPRANHPIGITTEVADAPWDRRHKLVLIGARAVSPDRHAIAGRNIVLLIDVSGSMASADKLPLVKSALGLFVDTLEPTDRIAIVTYAGSSGVALPPTRARERERILDAIAGLGAGGSTNGAGGIATAYRLARESFIRGGVNRVILATDGDFNVGVTSRDGLLDLIQREKESGVFLSVLGVGTGNLQDATMEMLADKGNGHYSYLDSLQEAQRVLVREIGSTLETVAKDVKFQVEFNPAEVASWKLIGYENRLMAHEDFNDDRKDGGEMGAGHTVTVLYEIVPVGVGAGDDEEPLRPVVDPLRYQAEADRSRTAPPVPAGRRGEWLTVKVRYQEPAGSTSRLITVPVATNPGVRPQFLPFAAAVAEFGLLLRDGRASSERWDDLIGRLASIPVPAALRADRDHVEDLATSARALVRLR